MKRLAILLGLGVVALAFVGGAQAQGGALDTTFGVNGGIAYLPDGVSVVSIATQTDGKIVGVGGICIAQCDQDIPQDAIAVARYNADGSLDSSFGANGVAEMQLGSDSFANAVLVQPDGKIVVAGESAGNAAVARFLPDGHPDLAFGSGGATAIPQYGFNWQVARQSDGKIVTAGDVATGAAGGALIVARFTTSGQRDPTFGDNGIAKTTVSARVPFTRALAIQPDGKILMGGDGESFLQLARYDTDGSLDTSFGHGGIVSLTTQESTPLGFALQDDGTFIVGVTPFGGGNFGLARFHANGSLDLAFGTGGFVTTPIGGPFGGEAHAMLVEPDGELLLAGEAGYNEPTYEPFAALALYKSDGSLDSSFGTGGILESAFAGSELTYDTALEPDGSIVALTRLFTGSGPDQNVLVRYLNQNGFNLSVHLAGNGSGMVTSDLDKAIQCPQICSSTLSAYTPVTLTAQPDVGTKFIGWSGACTGLGPCQVMMRGARSVTANFRLDSERMTVRVVHRGGSGGSVFSIPDGIDCANSCAARFPYGSSVELMAEPGPRSIFLGWRGACLGWLIDPCQLTVTAPEVVTAAFAMACIVPNVEGRRLAGAKHALRRAHCAVGHVRRNPSSRVQTGRVITQRPHAGRKLFPRSKVNLIVSRGKR